MLLPLTFFTFVLILFLVIEKTIKLFSLKHERTTRRLQNELLENENLKRIEETAMYRARTWAIIRESRGNRDYFTKGELENIQEMGLLGYIDTPTSGSDKREQKKN